MFFGAHHPILANSHDISLLTGYKSPIYICVGNVSVRNYHVRYLLLLEILSRMLEYIPDPKPSTIRVPRMKYFGAIGKSSVSE